MKSQVSTPVVAVIIVVVVLLAGFLIKNAVTGGVQGDGKDGQVLAMPPTPGGQMPPTPDGQGQLPGRPPVPADSGVGQ